MSSYPFFIPEFVLCANSSLFSLKIANEPSEFRNYLSINFYQNYSFSFYTYKYHLFICYMNYILTLTSWYTKFRVVSCCVTSSYTGALRSGSRIVKIIQYS